MMPVALIRMYFGARTDGLITASCCAATGNDATHNQPATEMATLPYFMKRPRTQYDTLRETAAFSMNTRRGIRAKLARFINFPILATRRAI
jgi:FPC/CPF motif-containing protein YcgG